MKKLLLVIAAAGAWLYWTRSKKSYSKLPPFDLRKDVYGC